MIVQDCIIITKAVETKCERPLDRYPNRKSFSSECCYVSLCGRYKADGNAGNVNITVQYNESYIYSTFIEFKWPILLPSPRKIRALGV